MKRPYICGVEMILIYPVFIGIGLLTAQFARDKGYSGRWWFLLGILLPLISLLPLYFLKRKERKKEGMYAPVEFKSDDKILYQRDRTDVS